MSVRELIRNKKYQIEVVRSYNGNKKDRYYETFWGGKKDAILRENQIKMEIKDGTLIPQNDLTIENLTKEWLEKKKKSVALKTYRGYVFKVKIINSKLGYIKLKNLNVKLLENFYDYLSTEYVTPQGKKISSTTIAEYHNIISNMLDQAITWEYIKTNPNKKVDKIKKAKTKVECYSPEEVEKLILALQQEPLKYQAVIYLALDSGCRRGELTRFNLG